MFSIETQRKTVQIEPFYLGNVKAGIEQRLNQKLMTFTAALEGIIVSYDNIQVLGTLSHIIDDSPFISIDIEVDWLVLRFTPGSVVHGVVTKVDGDALDLLVFDTFNVRIQLGRLVQSARFREAFLAEGARVAFAVVECKRFHKNKMVQITGALPMRADIGVADGGAFRSITDIVSDSDDDSDSLAAIVGAKSELRERKEAKLEKLDSGNDARVAVSTPAKKNKKKLKKEKGKRKGKGKKSKQKKRKVSSDSPRKAKRRKVKG